MPKTQPGEPVGTTDDASYRTFKKISDEKLFNLAGKFIFTGFNFFKTLKLA